MANSAPYQVKESISQSEVQSMTLMPRPFAEESVFTYSDSVYGIVESPNKSDVLYMVASNCTPSAQIGVIEITLTFDYVPGLALKNFKCKPPPSGNQSVPTVA